MLRRPTTKYTGPLDFLLLFLGQEDGEDLPEVVQLLVQRLLCFHNLRRASAAQSGLVARCVSRRSGSGLRTT